MSIETPPSSLAIYLRLLKYLKPLMGYFIISLIGFSLFAASQPMLAKTMELIIEALEAKNTDARLYLPAMAIGIFVLRGIGTFLGTYYNEYVGAKLIQTLRIEVFDQLLVLPAEYYDRESQGTILHRLSSSVTQVTAAVTNAMKTLIREGLTIIALLGYVFYLNWQLSLIFLLTAPVLGYLVTTTGRKFRKITRKNEGALSNALQITKETVGNYSIVRAFGAEQHERNRYLKALARAFKAQMKIRQVQATFTPISQLVIAMAVAGIVALLLDPYFLERSTTGELIGYLTAVALIPKPLRQLSGIGVIIQKGVVGAELIFNIIDEKPEEDTGTHQVERVSGELSINNLHFSYPSAERPALQGVSFHANPGEMIALVGKSGSGKTTLASLLYRLYSIDDDAIQIDGIDVNQYQLTSLRRQFSIVSQNVALFDDSIRNNIGYGTTNYTDEQIIEALQKAHALEFIEQLPDGLDTRIGENGFKLSGGQRQRLAIARAFLKNAPILILDEATSALDNESEAIITEGIEALTQSRTTIVIAHRLSTILKADRLIVMEKGKIVEQGTHEQLINKEGYYQKLYRAELAADD